MRNHRLHIRNICRHVKQYAATVSVAEVSAWQSARDGRSQIIAPGSRRAQKSCTRDHDGVCQIGEVQHTSIGYVLTSFVLTLQMAFLTGVTSGAMTFPQLVCDMRTRGCAQLCTDGIPRYGSRRLGQVLNAL